MHITHHQFGEITSHHLLNTIGHLSCSTVGERKTEHILILHTPFLVRILSSLRGYVSYHIPVMPAQDDIPDLPQQQELDIYLNLVCNYLPP